MIIVEKITFRPDKKLWEAVFSNGRHVLLEEDTYISLSLYPGKELDESVFSGMEYKNQLAQLKQVALRYCARRKTEWEVRRRLEEEEASPGLIDDVISFLYSVNLLNDEEYARDFIEDKRKLHLDGPIKIRSKLKERGIPSSILTRAFSAFPEELWEEPLQLLIEKRNADIHVEKERRALIRYLTGKGYSYGMIFREL